jgi:hypothetical protein
MKKLFLLIALMLGFTAAYATVPNIVYTGNASLATGSNQIYLDGGTGTHQFHHVSVFTLSGADTIDINFNLNGAATSADTPLVAGAGFNYGFTTPPSPATNQVNYYDASSGTGTIGWMAW